MGLPTPMELTRTYRGLKEGTAARRARDPEKPKWGTTILFLAPASVLLIVFLIYPAIYTVFLSFNRGRNGIFNEWVGLDNYARLFADQDFLNLSTFPPSGALWNNVLWLVLYVSIVIFFGLILAVVAARVRYEAVLKAIVFIPMAIAATALAVIWKFVYSPDSNIGLLNAILGAVGIAPVSWLGDQNIVNFALIAVGIWGSVGFATVILSAAVRSIPAEVIESARVEGANERQIFFRMILPMVSLPISVLAVTLVVNVIKLFDLIFVMTGGGPGKASQVIAFTMFQQAFEAGQYGYGSAVAVIMLILLTPIMIFNVRRFRAGSVTSFRPRADIQSTGWWDIFNLHLTLENYGQVLQAQGMFQAFLNTVFIAVPSTLLPLAICAMAAYAFSWMKFPLRDTLFLIVVGLLMVPVQVAFIPVLIGMRELLPDLQLTRGYVAVWLAHTAFALPFGIFLLRNFFITLPPDMIEAARIDGASDVRIFRMIVVPVSVPAIAAYGIFQFLWVWNDLLMALVFVQDSTKYPMTRAIQSLLSQYGTEWHLLAAGAFLLMVVPLIVFFSLQRYFVQGLLAGSIK